MSMEKTVEPDFYDLPHNYEDCGGVIGGRFKGKNAAEGIGGAGFILFFVFKILPLSFGAKAGIATLFGFPVLVLGLFGIGNEPVSSYLYYMIRFNKSKRRLVYKRGYDKHVESTTETNIKVKKQRRNK